MSQFSPGASAMPATPGSAVPATPGFANPTKQPADTRTDSTPDPETAPTAGTQTVPRQTAVSARLGLRLLLLLLAGTALINGLNGAAALTGVRHALPANPSSHLHGILLVIGFLGTAIGLERAVAARRSWAYAAPALTGLGALLALLQPLLQPLPQPLAPNPTGVPSLLLVGTLWTAGMVVLTLTYGFFLARQSSLPTMLEGLGALLGLAGTAFWTATLAGLPATFHQLKALNLLLLLFLVLTIVGERFELAHLNQDFQKRLPLATLLAAGLAVSACFVFFTPRAGVFVGVILVALGLLLIRDDIARRTLKARGLPRFCAAAMLAGYFWLLVAGFVWAVAGFHPAGILYELPVHALTLGFTISMVFAHAPIIIPAVIHKNFPYSGALWVPLVALHVGLLVRFWLSFTLELPALHQLGSAGNIVTIFVFVGLVLVSINFPRAVRNA